MPGENIFQAFSFQNLKGLVRAKTKEMLGVKGRHFAPNSDHRWTDRSSSGLCALRATSLARLEKLTNAKPGGAIKHF